jgi:chorismate mutase
MPAGRGPPAVGVAAMTAVRAIRGAIQIDRDDPDVILADTGTLLVEIIRRNDLAVDDVISVLFTMTPDLASGFPAAAVRNVGLAGVPLLCATEIGVPNAMERVIRLLAHIQTDRPQSAIEHVYLRGAARLRPDTTGCATASPIP